MGLTQANVKATLTFTVFPVVLANNHFDALFERFELHGLIVLAPLWANYERNYVTTAQMIVD